MAIGSATVVTGLLGIAGAAVPEVLRVITALRSDQVPSRRELLASVLTALLGLGVLLFDTSGDERLQIAVLGAAFPQLFSALVSASTSQPPADGALPSGPGRPAPEDRRSPGAVARGPGGYGFPSGQPVGEQEVEASRPAGGTADTRTPAAPSEPYADPYAERGEEQLRPAREAAAEYDEEGWAYDAPSSDRSGRVHRQRPKPITRGSGRPDSRTRPARSVADYLAWRI